MNVTHTKTGAKRHRVETRWFRKPLVVLQVEMHAKGHSYTAHIGIGHNIDYKYWRDAQVEDITEEKK